MRIRVVWAAMAALLLCQACGQGSVPMGAGAQVPASISSAGDDFDSDEPAPDLPEQSEPQTEPVATEAPAEVTVKVLNWEQTAKLVGSKKGKVVVVDFWATYCPPCVKEFPNLVQLHKKHGDKIACISVSADYEGDNIAPLKQVEGPVLEQLQKFGATFDNVLLNITSEDLNKKIGVTSVPVVMVFGKDGKRIAMFPDPKNPDEFTYAKDILPIVNKALAE